MHPLAPHYEQKTRPDHGKKRPRESNASSSSTTLNHPSSSRPLDDTIDENDDESFHSNSSSPFSKRLFSSVCCPLESVKNPFFESYNSEHLSLLTLALNLQTQQRDAHREGLRSIGQALKNMMDGKRKFVFACWRISSTTTDVYVCDVSVAACYDMKTISKRSGEESNYEKLLPIMADKYEYEKRKKEKLEEIKARLDFAMPGRRALGRRN
ncbi:hypothetical protein Tco_0772895 [Tanacetum coccineum]|uniref:Uncharacterized protein n=1 Tax=Tanacetum coccineum TaxID=301880 RepID=A0ABQ4ZJ73_9ASTR